jgi:hypothetical protein
MVALSLGLQALRFAPASRAAKVICKDCAHDAWALREELSRVLSEIRREDPAWWEEFVQMARRLDPKLLQAILPH